jgi:hypothetical protein
LYELRPYQTEAIEAINEHWQDWQRELLVLPTGCHEPNQGIQKETQVMSQKEPFPMTHLC